MTKHIDIKDYKKIGVNKYKNSNTSEIIIEKKIGERHFEYFDQDDNYLGRYNSEYGIFDDDIVMVALNSFYR